MTQRPGEHVSARWADWREQLPIDLYERRFARMAEIGEQVHGEADFICRYKPSLVLDAGCGTGRVAIELAARGIDVVGVDLDDEMLAAARIKAPELAWICADLAGLDLGRQFDVVAMPGNIPLFCRIEDRPKLVAGVARHVSPTGVLISGFSLEPGGYDLPTFDAHCAIAGLVIADRFSTWDADPYTAGNYAVSVHRLR
jgi:SAM-dependent methyltransferase